MKQFLSILLLICLFDSCKEKTSYQMTIIIKNETNSILTVKLYPKSEYMSGEFYDFADTGGGHRNTEFEIDTIREFNLYITGDITMKPYTLTSQVFDSIHIIPSNGYKEEIKFSPETVIGYTENLYNDNSEWIYEVRNFDLPDNFQRNPVESHDYIYVISENKYSQFNTDTL